jgi:maleamate amidohydrolase
MGDRFDQVGYSGRSVGFGGRPAIVTVDFQLGFTHPDFPSGRSPHIHRAVENTARLLATARPLAIPVISCNVSWGSEKEMGYWKVDALYRGEFWHGHPSTALDPRIHDAGYDICFTKSAPSIFFLTPLVSILTRNHIDTVIVCGCTTSGCVRASIVDSFSYGYRTIVPEECVGDMEEGPHWDNLRDVGRRYADVMKLEDVLNHLRGAERAPLAAVR